MSRIAFIIIFFTGFFYVSGVFGRSIPGIDPSTMSVDPDPNYSNPLLDGKGPETQPLPSKEGEVKIVEPGRSVQPEANPNYLTPAQNVDPMITGLSVTRLEDDPYSVKLSWNTNLRNESPIYIARSEVPFTTRQTVMDADNITSPPLSSQETLFIDKNIPSGTYYYAILTRNEIAARGNLILKRGANMSLEPMAILRDDGRRGGPPVANEEKLSRYRVLGLTAEDHKDRIILKWLPAEAKNIHYTVYRGNMPLDTKDRILSAQRLGIVEEGTNKFEDTTPANNKRVFYGVTVTDKKTNLEVTDLIYRQSYIEHSFGVPDEKKYLADLPGGIITYRSAENEITVFWSDPESDFDSISVYRSMEPISNEEQLSKANKIADVEKGVKKYIDKELEPGMYFYAVFPEIDKKNIFAFLQDRTYSTGGIAIRIEKENESELTETPSEPDCTDPKTEEEIALCKKLADTEPDCNAPKTEEEKIECEKKKELSGETPVEPEILYFRMLTSQDSVKLLWEVNKYDPASKFLIFRSKKFMQSYKDVLKNGKLLDEIPPYIKEYVDEGVAEGIYYYALVVERKGKIEEKLTAGKNYVLEPAIVTGKKVDPEESEVAEGNPDEEPEVIEPNEVVKEDTGVKEPADLNEEMLEHQKKLNELNRILSTTFIKNKFQEAVRKLKPFTGDHKIPEGVRARAMFYSGLSYFNMRKYKQALFYFSNSDVRAFYPMRSNFWIKRSVEKIR
ncbi:MAG: hypothetical protein OEZ34_08455 [Spirochaetia bacterium]|nr:hypothetical protein [Spirochaetia bacterium]